MRLASLAIAAAVMVAGSALARADVYGQRGAHGGLFYDTRGDRLTGIGASAYGDIRGIGLVFGIDYQNLSMESDDGRIFGHTLGLTFGLRFSPLALYKAEVPLRYVDVYAAAALDGGLVLRRGRADRGTRSTSYTALGLELRPGKGRLPCLVIEYQWRQQAREFRVGDTVFIGVGLRSAGYRELRD